MERFQNRGQNSFAIGKDVVVPKPHDQKVISRKPVITALIAARIRVLPTISFDDHAQFITNEISDKRAYRRLPAKLEARKTTVPQREPQLALRVGHARTQFPCPS